MEGRALGPLQQQNIADSNMHYISCDKKRKQATVSLHCQVLTFYLDGLQTVSKLSIECVRVADLLDCCVAI